MEIESDVIHSLNEWNTPPMDNDLDMDYRFALAAFLSLVPVDNILENTIDPNAIDFMLGNFKLHVS